MDDLFKTIAKFGFYVMALAIIGWTGMHTYDILYYTNPIPDQQFLAIYGLLVFEAGTLVWFAAFLKHAEGMGQHAISLIGAILGAVLVMAAFLFDYMTPRGELVGYNSMARWAVVLATCVDFAFVLLYELFNPKVWEDLQENIHVAMLYAKAEAKARQKIDEDSDALAEQIGQNRKERAFARAALSGIKEVPTASDAHPSRAAQKQYAASTRAPDDDDSKNAKPPRP